MLAMLPYLSVYPLRRVVTSRPASRHVRRHVASEASQATKQARQAKQAKHAKQAEHAKHAKQAEHAKQACVFHTLLRNTFVFLAF